jgi:hypothetical protein
MPAKAQDRQTNVIAFPRAQRNRAAMTCEDATRADVCSHCGGRLTKGESEDDCSSARISRLS